MPSGRLRRVRVVVVAALALFAAAATAAPASAAPRGAGDVRVLSVATLPSTALEVGDELRVAGRAVNRGKRRARGRITATLRTSARARIGRVVARQRLRALAPGARARYRLSVTIPAGTRAGRYRLQVCARVGERAARCRTARGWLTVAAATPGPSAPATSGPPSAPAPGAAPAGGAGGGGGTGGGGAPPPPAPPPGPGIVIEDGVTAPVFGYADAVRDRVWVQTDFDTDRDGRLDRVAVDIIRPAATREGLKVPVVMVASPYWTARDPETEEPPSPRPAFPDQSFKQDSDSDGLNDIWPSFYDNYFVPRGYAVALVDAVGTTSSTGCSPVGGREDVHGVRLVIDWFNGRARGYDAVEGGARVDAAWSTGKVGMIGLSYNGTLANGVAATGVAGLETIVPQAAISSWYDYYRTNGLRLRGSDGPFSLADFVTPPDRRAACAPSRQALTTQAGDNHGSDSDLAGNYNAFWADRDYVPDASKVRASVFMVNGMNDLNVKPSHAGPWWDTLAAHDVPRKVWLSQLGHWDPAYYAPERWVPTLHRWFDYWLQDVDNGVLDEPMAEVEQQPAGPGQPPEYRQYASWPDPGVRQATVWLAQESTYPGELRTTQQTEDVFTASWSDDRAQTQAAAIADPEVAQDHRVVFLSPPLTEPVRISGQSVLTARVTTDVASGALGAMLVDYADGQPPFTTIDYTVRDGMDWLTTETCFGLAGALDSGCLPDVTRRLLDGVTAEVVTRGAIDLGNRDSLWEKTPTVPGTPTWAKVPLWTKDYTFPAGHRIGLVLVGSYPDHESVPPTRDAVAEYTLDAAATNLSLPVVGGKEALGF